MPSRAVTRARSPTSEPLPASSGPTWLPAAWGGAALRQLPRGGLGAAAEAEEEVDLVL